MEDIPKINKALGYDMLIQLIENSPRYRELEETILENIEKGYFVSYFNIYENIVSIVRDLEITLDPHIATQIVVIILFNRFSGEKINISLTPESILEVSFQESLLQHMKDRTTLAKKWVLKSNHLEDIKF